MTPRTTLILVVVAILAVAGGWYYGIRPEPAEHATSASGSLVFPDLAEKLQNAAKIEVQHQGTTLVIAKEGDRWGLPDRGGYPVSQSKLHELFNALTELRITESRTSDPSEFNRLGVEDPNDKTATSNLLRVLDAAGKPIAELIVGHRRVRTQGNVPESVYIRRVGQNQAWLAEGSLSVDADPQLWIERDIMNVAGDKVAGVVVTRPDETLTFAREGDKLVLKTPADAPKLDDYKLEDVMRSLESLTLTDVKPASQEPGDKIGTGVFTTNDGETITATVFKVGTGDKAEIWSQFAVAGDGKVKDDAAKLEARVAGWAYQLGSWKEAALVPTLNDLKAEAPPQAPASALPGLAQPAAPAPAIPVAPAPATPSAPAATPAAPNAPAAPNPAPATR
jgi:hypothetical protein